MPSKTEEYLALAQRTANGLTRYWVIEPIKIDLPAPVSPVRIFNPEEKSTSISSIIAKFFTCKFTNNSLLPFHYFNFVTFTRHPSFTPLTTA